MPVHLLSDVCAAEMLDNLVPGERFSPLKRAGHR